MPELAFLRIAEVTGRRQDDFAYGSVMVPASAFRHVLGTDPRVTEYQVTQTAKGAEILVVGDPDPAELSGAIEAAFAVMGCSTRRSALWWCTSSRVILRPAS